MELWDDLVKSALVGTARDGALSLSTTGPLGEVLGKLNGDPEGRLLAAAGVLSVYQRAGAPLKRMEAVQLVPAGDERLPRVGARAGAHLGLMLGGEHGEVLGEWLGAVAKAGKRAPEEWLPGLLHVGKTQSQLRDLVLPVLGERGRWLAGQNPEWDYVAGQSAIDEGLWETGTRAVRVGILRQVRRQNPPRGRELLERTWEQETPEDRAAFVEALAPGLGMEDEPFLETRLDDKRKEVRKSAADLLATLPESRLVKRMTDRLRPLLSLEKGKKGLKVVVGPPDHCDAAMERDGVDKKRREGTAGEKMSWFIQMLGVVPPAVWTRELKLGVEDLVAAGGAGEFREELWEGWAVAARRHGDAKWAEALLSAAIQRGGKKEDGSEVEHVAGLLPLLPVARREPLLLELLQSRGGAAAVLLDRGALHPWSAKLSRAVLDHVRKLAEKADYQAAWRWGQTLKKAGARMDVTLAAEAADGWPQDGKGWSLWKSAVEQMLTTLQFRRDMLEAIKEP